MPVTEQALKDALSTVKYPGFSRDIVSFGLVKSIKIDGSVAQVKLTISTNEPQIPAQIKAEAEAALKAVEGVERAEILIAVTKPKAPAAQTEEENSIETMQQVKYCIAVASGKGGVGKSTVSVNLAAAMDAVLRQEGKANAVGIMDCDIYGPSIPLMLGVNMQPEIEDNLIQPVENFGIRVMSMGLLVDETTPVVWRGPMIQKTIQQFAMNVDWGELEVLIIDLPPGTGDAQLSLVQTIPLDGAVIVTTPQPAAYQVARRGAGMFEKVSVPLLGVVENMSYMEMPDGSKQQIFGEGGGTKTAEDLNTPLLGQIPLDTNLRIGSDQGIPSIVQNPDSKASKAFISSADKILRQLRK